MHRRKQHHLGHLVGAGDDETARIARPSAEIM
jgi:hypothetical protein